jgi:hypothetical protein
MAGVLGSAACNAIVGVHDLPWPDDPTTGEDAGPDATPDAGLDTGTKERDADAEAPGDDRSMPVDSGDEMLDSEPPPDADDAADDSADDIADDQNTPTESGVIDAGDALAPVDAADGAADGGSGDSGTVD